MIKPEIHAEGRTDPGNGRRQELDEWLLGDPMIYGLINVRTDGRSVVMGVLKEDCSSFQVESFTVLSVRETKGTNQMPDNTAKRLGDGEFLDARPTPCGDRRRPAIPDKPTSGPSIGLTFSGGGFRATFAAMGVVRYLADVGLLGNVRYVSSVSGGSITNALLADNWTGLQAKDYSADAVHDLVIDPPTRKITSSSLKRYLLRNSWRAIGNKNRTDVLAHAFKEWFVGSTTMDQLDPEVRWIINAANLATGTRFTFERDVVGDYVNGYANMSKARVPLALAAAASAAVPGPFAPVELKRLDLPCRGVNTVSLLDGGAYDNTGLEAIDSDGYDHVFTIALTAGGVFHVGGYGRIPIAKDLMQANSVLYRQSRALRMRSLVDRFQDGLRDGVLFNLGTTIKERDQTPEAKNFAATYPEHDAWNDKPLEQIDTSFDRFEPGLARHLIHRGWWLTGMTLATYHPTLNPPPPSLTAPAL